MADADVPVSLALRRVAGYSSKVTTINVVHGAPENVAPEAAEPSASAPETAEDTFYCPSRAQSTITLWNPIAYLQASSSDKRKAREIFNKEWEYLLQSASLRWEYIRRTKPPLCAPPAATRPCARR